MPSKAESMHVLADAATIVLPDARLVTYELPARHVLDWPRWGWSLFHGQRCLCYASGMATADAARAHALRWARIMMDDDRS